MPTKTELMNNPDVKQEIERYKWVESEKLGADIGYERAAEEWLKNCSKEWLKLRVDLKKPAARRAKKV
ncbi:MAG: hypothetical protein HQL17_01155 [Candidatus Omnitrophica bacterium]|nr:hypothetical protein [Candidatus Omnitrophota bacterium]